MSPITHSTTFLGTLQKASSRSTKHITIYNSMIQFYNLRINIVAIVPFSFQQQLQFMMSPFLSKLEPPYLGPIHLKVLIYLELTYINQLQLYFIYLFYIFIYLSKTCSYSSLYYSDTTLCACYFIDIASNTYSYHHYLSHLPICYLPYLPTCILATHIITCPLRCHS